MKNKFKSIIQFLAILLALLSIGMHTGTILVPMLKSYKFDSLLMAFVLLFLTLFF